MNLDDGVCSVTARAACVAAMGMARGCCWLSHAHVDIADVASSQVSGYGENSDHDGPPMVEAAIRAVTAKLNAKGSHVLGVS